MMRLKEPDIVVRRGKPVAVIVDIETYADMLERLEQLDDIRALEEMRKRPLKFHSLQEVLDDYEPKQS